MKLKPISIFWIFVWCIFMGITVGSIGLGAVVPSVNRITAPFVCGRGRLELVTKDYHPSPVQKVTTLTWYCADPNTGARQEVSFIKMALIAGPFYGLLLFLIVMVVMWVRSSYAGEHGEPLGDYSLAESSYASPTSLETPERRLMELKRLRDSGLITDREYELKKTQILSDL